MTQLPGRAGRSPIAPLLMASGRRVDLANLRPEEIHWPDLVENLVKIPRFAGATPQVTYSAAQRCCLLYDRAAPVYKPHALLRDFYKALAGCTTWPFWHAAAEKAGMPDAFLDALEEMAGDITDAITAAAGLEDTADDDAVTARFAYLDHLSKKLTATERRDLMATHRPLDPGLQDHWPLPEPFPQPIKAWGQDKARAELETRLAAIGVAVKG